MYLDGIGAAAAYRQGGQPANVAAAQVVFQQAGLAWSNALARHATPATIAAAKAKMTIALDTLNRAKNCQRSGNILRC